MNAKLAHLIMRRARAARDYANPDEFRLLANSIYPDIAANAYKGLNYVWLHGQISDTVVDVLRANGYVIRHGKAGMTIVEWGLQTIIDGGMPKTLTPEEYNKDWVRYELLRRTD